MYDYENNSQNAGGSASDSGTESGTGTGSDIVTAGRFIRIISVQPLHRREREAVPLPDTATVMAIAAEATEYRRGASEKEKQKEIRKTDCKDSLHRADFWCCGGSGVPGNQLYWRQLFGDKVTASGSSNTTAAVPEIGTVTPQTGSSASTGNTVADIVEECMPSLVAITNVSIREVQNYWGFGWYSQPQEQEEVSTGTGIIIGQNDSELLIVTNNHVISGATTLTVLFSVDEGNEDASAVEAQIKGTDATKDIGVIAVPLDEIPDETMAQIKRQASEIPLSLRWVTR